MTLEQLYAQYGQQMIQLEILNGQINETKKAIVAESNKPKVAVPEARSE